MADENKYLFRGRDAVSMKDGLKKLYSSYNIESKMDQMSIQDHWRKMMGNAIANKTTSIVLEKSTLTIKLDSPILKQELQYAKEKIKTHLNEVLEKELIQNVIIM